MKKASIRIRFSIAIGLLICFFSLITMIFSINNVKESIENSKSALDYNKTAIKEEIKNSIKDEVSLSENIDKENIVNLQPTFDIDESIIENTKVVSTYNEAIDIINEAQDKIVLQQIMFSMFLGLLGMLISYPISTILLRPFTNLSSDIEGVTAANLKEHLTISNEKDEIGKIKNSFNIMLDRLNNSFERQKLFSSNVAHELKTPLAVIKTYTQIIDEDSDLDEYKDVVEVTSKNVDRMIELVNDFVDYVKEENVKIEKFSILKVIDESLIELDTLIKKKDIKIYKEIEDFEILSNPMMFKRMVYNLINNAIKYNKDHGSIYISLENNILSIRDTGIGIDEENIKHIFEPLYCVDKSRSRELGGSGLGLSIVENICSSLNYKIEVSSKLNYGTEFQIKL